MVKQSNKNLRRSYLYTNARTKEGNRKLLESLVKQAKPAYFPDCIIIDLEDGVPSETEKLKVREAYFKDNKTITILKNYKQQGARIILRINSQETKFFKDDLSLALKMLYLDGIAVPKIKTIKELKTVEDKVRKLYLKTGRRLEIHPIIETKEAFCFREEILAREAKYPEIYQVADFGLGDFTQEMNLPSPPLVLKDKLLQSYIIDFSKTALYYGVHFIVGPFWGLTKKADLEELKKECYFLKDYAVKGRVAIHPGHINIINNIFSKYSAQDINKAHKIISAYQKAAKLNKLPLVINKKYIGLPEYKRCLNIISELKT